MTGTTVAEYVKATCLNVMFGCISVILLVPWFQSGPGYQKILAPFFAFVVLCVEQWDGAYPAHFWWRPVELTLWTYLLATNCHANPFFFCLTALTVTVYLIVARKEWVARGKAPAGARAVASGSVWLGYRPFDGGVFTLGGEERSLAIVSIKGRYARVRAITSQVPPQASADRFVELDGSNFGKSGMRWLEVGAPPKRIPVGYLIRYQGVVGLSPADPTGGYSGALYCSY